MSGRGFRVLHFSDVHVQRPVLSAPTRELMGKRFLAGLNLWLSRGKHFVEARDKLHALASFAGEQRISLGLCSGDYTAIGTQDELSDARAAVDEIARASTHGLVTVPGNHDLYLPDTLRDQRFDRHFGDVLSTDLPEYRSDGPFPFVRLFEPELAIVGVNSARPNPNPFRSSGRVPDAQLEALTRITQDARVRGRWLIVMTHYGILRRDGKPDSKSHGLDNGEALVRICARPRTLLVHGHIHHTYHHAATPERPWLFCAGSATQTDREGFWLYDVSSERLVATPGSYVEGRYRLRPEAAVSIEAARENERA
ncbi:MAG TPA: metallophosphoesterase [Polyangiales bacterium]